LFNELGGFYEEPKCREDLDFYLRLAARSETIALPEMLVRVREHAGRSTAAFGDAHERTARAFERFLSRDPGNSLAPLAKGVWSRHLADAAAERLLKGEFREAWHFFVRAMRGGAGLIYCARAMAHRAKSSVKSRYAPGPESGRR
jgi:hypothetical protein